MAPITADALLYELNLSVTNAQRAYFFYIMASRSRTLYCGVTSDLFKRVWQHKTKRGDGFTAKYNVERLVLAERYYDIRDAIAREKQVKRWRRGKKIWLIERQNATWLDLSEGWYDNLLDAGPSTRAKALARDDEIPL